MALADPGRILSMDKLVAAAANQLRGPQVHVVADPESRGQRRAGEKGSTTMAGGEGGGVGSGVTQRPNPGSGVPRASVFPP